MRWRSIFGGIFLALAALGSAQTTRIDFKVRPVWAGITPSQNQPCYADIENNGVDTVGVIGEENDYGSLNIEYPVELPSGARKRVLVFSTGYGSASFRLRTRIGDVRDRMQVSYGGGASAIYGLISDNPDDLGFLKGNSQDSSDQGGVQTGGCKPEEAPDRLSAYSCLDVLVLGEGTERLSESQIIAIKNYVKGGGAVIFIGGVAKSASTDSRWNDIRPATGLRVENRTINSETVSELLGTASPGAKQTEFEMGRGWVSDYGFGSVGMLSVNPFESPVRTYSGRRAMLLKVAPRNRRQAAGWLTSSMLQVRESTGAPFTGEVQDPFEISAPPAGSLAWLVVLYILVVVPINFLILRKLKRVELAWVTVPIISVIFSLLLLRSTIGLYRSKASTRTSAVVSLDGSGGSGVVLARSEMFFPSADAHDLGLKQVDGIYHAVTDNDYGYYNRESASAMNFVDNGRALTAPACETTNLAFREFSLVQITDELKGIRCEAKPTSAGQLISLTNGSHYDLENVYTNTTGSNVQSAAKIVPGQTVRFALSKAQLYRKMEGNPEGNRLLNGQVFPVYIQFRVKGLRVGPDWGSEHPGSSVTAYIHPSGGKL